MILAVYILVGIGSLLVGLGVGRWYQWSAAYRQADTEVAEAKRGQLEAAEEFGRDRERAKHPEAKASEDWESLQALGDDELVTYLMAFREERREDGPLARALEHASDTIQNILDAHAKTISEREDLETERDTLKEEVNELADDLAACERRIEENST